jgi:hypothetical protein
MTKKIDLDHIATRLGAERRGPVKAAAGFFGALQLAAEVRSRLQVPTSGGRPTDPSWSLRRQIPLSPETLERLDDFAREIRKRRDVHVEPMQIAALILEKGALQLSGAELVELLSEGVLSPPSDPR